MVSTSWPGHAGATSSTSCPRPASSSPASRSPRTHSSSGATPSGLSVVSATRSRPGSRRTAVAYGSTGRGAQLASPTS